MKNSWSNQYIAYCGLMVTTVIVLSILEFFWTPSFLINSVFEVHLFPIFILAFTAPVSLSLTASVISFGLRMILVKPRLIIAFGQVILDYIVPYLAPTFFVYFLLFLIWLFNKSKAKNYYNFSRLNVWKKIFFVESVLILSLVTIYTSRSVAGALYFFYTTHNRFGLSNWEYGFISNFFGAFGIFTFNIVLFIPMIRLIDIFKNKQYAI